ncbi:MAG: hypothetical protein IT249_19940 [Chitinophagaceae bacterium]|nr:hypothetical protein [Chitinophagaceae bacterium]
MRPALKKKHQFLKNKRQAAGRKEGKREKRFGDIENVFTFAPQSKNISSLSNFFDDNVSKKARIKLANK